jgi:hypothetical protein
MVRTSIRVLPFFSTKSNFGHVSVVCGKRSAISHVGERQKHWSFPFIAMLSCPHLCRIATRAAAHWCNTEWASRTDFPAHFITQARGHFNATMRQLRSGHHALQRRLVCTADADFEDGQVIQSLKVMPLTLMACSHGFWGNRPLNTGQWI